MVAHSQFCMAGDNTLEAASIAIDNILRSSSSSSLEEDTENQRYSCTLSSYYNNSFYNYVNPNLQLLN